MTGAPRGTRGVSRQQIRDDLQASRIADLEERLPTRDYRGALAEPLEHHPIDWRKDVHRSPPPLDGVNRARARSSSWVARASANSAARTALARLEPGLRGLELVAETAPPLTNDSRRARWTPNGPATQPHARVRPGPGRRRPGRRQPRHAAWPACADRSAGKRQASSARRGSCRGPRDRPARARSGSTVPETGAETMNRSRTRVSPSSSIVTCIGPAPRRPHRPRSPSARGRLPGSPQRRHRGQQPAVLQQSLLLPYFSTATRSSVSSASARAGRKSLQRR